MALPPRRPPRPERKAGAPVRHRPGAPHFGDGAARVRRGTVRVAGDVAWRLRAGHPFVFRDALGGRPMREAAGDVIDVVDDTGVFVARGLYDPTGPIAVRLFTRAPDGALDAATLLARVRAARAWRTTLLDGELTAYRAVHGEGDGIPGITVDRYGDYLVVHLYSAAVERTAPLVHDALEAVWKPRAIYQQQRFRPQTGEGPRAPAELVRGSAAPIEVEVVEDGLKVAVDVTAPLGTGLFPDLRQGRRAVRRLSTGRRVLNLFSYTGAFSLHAGRGGATEVVSVDLAAKAHGRARHNLGLNGIPEAGQEFVTGDAMKVLARMVERGRRFDLVIIDPPSFAQGKDGKPFVAQKDYRDLVTAALGVLEPGSILCAASNTARLPIDEFDRILGDGAQHAGRSLAVVERVGLPPDFPVPAGFPEGHYLKFEICAVG